MAVPATPAVPVKKTFRYGKHEVTFETAAIARQATAAVMVHVDETVVFVSVVGKKEAKPDQDFFPLTVDYMERFYAGGRIPGGFFKREGRPTEKRSEEHTSELQSLMRISYAVFCLKKKIYEKQKQYTSQQHIHNN